MSFTGAAELGREFPPDLQKAKNDAPFKLIGGPSTARLPRYAKQPLRSG